MLACDIEYSPRSVGIRGRRRRGQLARAAIGASIGASHAISSRALVAALRQHERVWVSTKDRSFGNCWHVSG